MRPSPLPALFLLGVGSFAAPPTYAAATGAWADGAARDQTFSRVLIVGISPDRDQRCPFERSMAATIKSAATVAIVSCDVMPSDAELTRESVEAAVAANDADAVLATSLISKKWETKEGATRDTQGDAYYKATDAYYGAYGTVVAADFRVSTPITTLQGSAHVTSKLYETRGATVVYTLDTKVRKIESRDEGIAAISEPIGKKLRKEGLIR
jgi:hypothetical protein